MFYSQIIGPLICTQNKKSLSFVNFLFFGVMFCSGKCSRTPVSLSYHMPTFTELSYIVMSLDTCNSIVYFVFGNSVHLYNTFSGSARFLVVVIQYVELGVCVCENVVHKMPRFVFSCAGNYLK